MVKENSPQEEEQLIPSVTVTGQSRLVKWKEQLDRCSSRSPEQHGREKERQRGDDADACVLPSGSDMYYHGSSWDALRLNDQRSELGAGIRN